MSEWQPIETAPKDGRWILAAWYHDDADDFGVAVGCVRYAGQHVWREKEGTGVDSAVGAPSHWMPLPEPPK